MYAIARLLVPSQKGQCTAEYRMLYGHAASTLCGVTDLYIVDFGGGERERACREAEREAERRRLADC
jgi:hypothetical protein